MKIMFGLMLIIGGCGEPEKNYNCIRCVAGPEVVYNGCPASFYEIENSETKEVITVIQEDENNALKTKAICNYWVKK